MTNELMQKAKACRSAEELLALAKENGYAMTPEEAAARFAELSGEGEMSDHELDAVSGGGCGDTYNDDGYKYIGDSIQCDLYTRSFYGAHGCVSCTFRYYEIVNGQYVYYCKHRQNVKK